MKMLGLLVLAAAMAGGAQEVTVPAGQRVVLTAEARGVQIYECRKSEGVAKWVFVAPDASLFVDGVSVGKHNAGPVWTYQDRSSVKGTVVATVEAKRKGAVPWLLLSGVGTGGGMLGSVDYVTRTGTAGGLVDKEVCNDGAVGTVLRKDYTATYTFYVAQ